MMSSLVDFVWGWLPGATLYGSLLAVLALGLTRLLGGRVEPVWIYALWLTVWPGY